MGWQTLQSDGTAKKIDTGDLNLAALAAAFGSIDELCADAANVPGSRYYSPGDVGTACLELQAAGKSAQAILVALATAYGVTAVDRIAAQTDPGWPPVGPWWPPPQPAPSLPTATPTPAPWTGQVDDIAIELRVMNPDLADLADMTMARTVAAQCIVSAIAAMEDPEMCHQQGLAIFVQGDDVPQSALNEMAGLIREPSWFVLDRRVPPDKADPPWDRTKYWYYDRGDPEPGCLETDRSPADAVCDEFPFWSTLQAYGGTRQTEIPNIAWTPFDEASIQGSNLNPRFYGTCSVEAAPTDSTAPPPASSFVTFALPPDLGVATLALCNRSAAK